MDKSQNYYAESNKRRSGKDKTQKKSERWLPRAGSRGRWLTTKGSTQEFLCDGNIMHLIVAVVTGWCMFVKYIDGTTKRLILLNKIIPQ